MRPKNLALAVALAAACLCAFAAPALAQDRPPAQPVTTRPGVARPSADTSSQSDLDAASQGLPRWTAWDTNDRELLEETFFRTARDFVGVTTLDVSRLGEVPPWPRGDLKLGPVRIFPYLREGVEYTSNLYLQPETGQPPGSRGRDAQWSQVNEFGLLADMLLAGGRLRLHGSVDSVWNVLWDHEKPNEWDLSANLAATYRWSSGVWLTVGVEYDRNDESIESEFTTGGDANWTDRRLFANLGFDRDVFFDSKAKFEVGFDMDQSLAGDEALDDMDRNDGEVWVKVSYPFWKETTRIFVLTTYEVLNRQSDSINDGQNFGFNVGMEGSIPLSEGEARSLRGTVSIGFDSALYENDTFTRGTDTIVADENRESTTLALEVGLQYVQSPRTTWDFRYTRDNEFSFYGNYQVVDHLELTASHNFTRQLVGRVQLYYEHGDPSGQVAQEDLDGGTPSSRADNANRYGAGAGLRYAITDWADIDASFDVEEFNPVTLEGTTEYRGVLGVTLYLAAVKPRARSAPAQP